MRLHSPDFERKVRRAVRAEVNRSPELKREVRRTNRWRSRVVRPALFRPLLSVVLGMAVWSVVSATRNPMAGLALVSLWGLYFFFQHAKNVRASLYGSDDLPALTLLPVSEDLVFRWQFHKFLRRSSWLLLDFGAGFIAVAIHLDWPIVGWVAVIPFSLLAWAEIVALSVLGAAFLPRLPYESISGLLMFVFFGFYVSRQWVGDAMLSFLDQHAAGILLLLPTGWPTAVFAILFPSHRYAFLCLLLPIGTLLWIIRSGVARLRVHYRYVESAQPRAPDLIPGEELDVDPEAPPPAAVGPTAIEEMILSRQFLRPLVPRSEGAVEKRLRGWLNRREQALAEFAFPDGWKLTSPWMRLIRNLLIGLVLTLVVASIGESARRWVLGVALFITVCQALSMVWLGGRAFQALGYSGMQIPISACYPIGFRELSRLLFKCSLVQAPFLFVYTSACGLMVGYFEGFPLVYAAVFGLKAGGLLLAARFISIALQFSSGTNDTTRIRLRSLPPILILTGLALGFLALGAGSLFVPETQIAWLLWLLAWVDAYGFFRVYQWFYHRNAFDLISRVQTS